MEWLHYNVGGHFFLLYGESCLMTTKWGKVEKTIVRSGAEAYNDIRDLENVVWKEAFDEP